MDAAYGTERITNFEYVNKFSVYDTQHNVFQLSALTMFLNDNNDAASATAT